MIISYVKNIILETDNLTFEKDEFSPTITSESVFLKSIIESKNECFLLAIIENKIIGNLSINNISRARVKHVGELSITVAKEYWNQGVATNLMTDSFYWLKTSELTKINLKVKEDNIEAIKLYKKFGFIKEGTITNDLYINSQYFNSICMGIIIE